MPSTDAAQDILSAIGERVRFARRRFGHYDVIDFVAVLFGYARSSERTLEVFYKRLHPFAPAFMAQIARERLPTRSTLSRFLASLTQPAVEALRTVFLDDLLVRPLNKERQTGGLVDRAGRDRVVFDIDGTREAARQRAEPVTPDLPAFQRRLDELCAPGYTGRKRGEVVRTRTVISQAHTSQWLGSFANPGNGKFREELRRAVAVIHLYSKAHDAACGAGRAPAGWAIGHRSCPCRSGGLLLCDARQRLHRAGSRRSSGPLAPAARSAVQPPGKREGSAPSTTALMCRWGRRGNAAGSWWQPIRLPKRRAGLASPASSLVYELFFTRLPQDAFTAADVVALYLHRGAFEPALADEDTEQDPDRWCSHAPAGQEAWQMVCQWVWNLRLERGHQLEPTPMRTTAFVPAAPEAEEPQAPSSGYGPPTIAAPWKAGRLSGQDFVLQSDGTLRCPANQALSATERRREVDGSLRLVYAAKMSQCRPCLLREQCQCYGHATTKPRRVSLLLHPLQVGSAPLLWKDWSRRQHRRACMHLLRTQRVEVTLPQATPPEPHSPVILSRAQRAHYRLSWAERLARNARAPTTDRPAIKLFGIPETFAIFLGLLTA